MVFEGSTFIFILAKLPFLKPKSSMVIAVPSASLSLPSPAAVVFVSQLSQQQKGKGGSKEDILSIEQFL